MLKTALCPNIDGSSAKSIMPASCWPADKRPQGDGGLLLSCGCQTLHQSNSGVNSEAIFVAVILEHHQ